MRKKLTALFVTLFLTFSLTFPIFAETEINDDGFRMINEVATYVGQYYKFGTSSENLKNKAIEYMVTTGDTNIDNVLKKMMGTLDQHSTYFTADEYKNFSDSLSASLCGIGATVKMTRSGAAILEVLKDSPAEKVGLKAYDVITEVDGLSIVGMTIDQAVNYVRGEPGSTVSLKIKRYGEDNILNYSLIRGNVEKSTVFWYKIDDDTAYLALTSLTLNCDVFFREALNQIDQAGINKIVLDLRDNSGGYLDATVNICDMLMPEGVVGYVDYKDPEKLETFYSDNKNPKYKLAVLINGATASGAEFLSGGLQDTKIGKLFGEESYGKGTVQTTRELINGGAFKVTIAKYYTAGKQDVAENHINPDIVVKNSYRQVNEDDFEPIDFNSKIEIGSEGKSVFAVEQRLSALGYMENPDEKFTDETMEAVRQFKADNALEPTPVVDFDFNSFLYNIEYNKVYYTVDKQLDAAVEYLKGIK